MDNQNLLQPVGLIKSKAQHDAYLQELQQLMALDPAKDTPEGDRLGLLVLVIQDYENEHYPIAKPLLKLSPLQLEALQAMLKLVDIIDSLVDSTEGLGFQVFGDDDEPVESWMSDDEHVKVKWEHAEKLNELYESIQGIGFHEYCGDPGYVMGRIFEDFIPLDDDSVTADRSA